jgi:hypothetical protein
MRTLEHPLRLAVQIKIAAILVSTTEVALFFVRHRSVRHGEMKEGVCFGFEVNFKIYFARRDVLMMRTATPNTTIKNRTLLGVSREGLKSIESNP